MPNYHVTKDQNAGQWQVLKEHAQRVSALAPTQRVAEQLAKEFAANSGGGEVRIHGLDGKIRNSDTVPPANDPFPPRDLVH